MTVKKLAYQLRTKERVIRILWSRYEFVYGPDEHKRTEDGDEYIPTAAAEFIRMEHLFITHPDIFTVLCKLRMPTEGFDTKYHEWAKALSFNLDRLRGQNGGQLAGEDDEPIEK